MLVIAGPLLGFSDAATPRAAKARVSPNLPVTAMDRTLLPGNNSPSLVADPTRHAFLALANRLDAPNFGCSLELSSDTGRGWITAQPVPTLPEGAEKCYAPEVAFDGDGVIYYLFIGLAGTGNQPTGAFLTTSANHGRTFTPPRQVLGALNFAVRMAIDRTVGTQGRLHLVWLHASDAPPLGGFSPTPNPIMSAYSDDGGRSFSKPLQVSDPARQRVVAPALSLGPHHSVRVVYYDLGKDAIDYQGLEGPAWDGTWSVVIASSSDGGTRFDRGVVVDDSVRPPDRVMLVFTMPAPAVSVHADRTCVAWTDARDGDADILLRCLYGPNSIGPLERLNDDTRGSGHRQYLPQLSTAPNGRLDAIFYDRRGDPRGLLNDVYYTFSTDGGHTFSRNVRLTDEGSNSLIGQRYAVVSAEGQVEFGSRLGLLSLGSSAVAAWADTRNGTADTAGQDIFTTTVTIGQRPQWSPGTLVGPLPIALSLLVLVGVVAGVRARAHRSLDGGR